ncbi:MAG: membrane protein [Pirellulaceae bacterium]|nr:MAG: membrane protein [Pirellulaceae bacterium]
MSFLQPWMLYASPLVALPVLIHLVSRRRFQTRPWGAMMFLLQAERLQRRMAKIRRWLILALRTLAVAALLLAACRPLASNLLGWAASSTDTTVLIIDRSPSMEASGVGERTKLATAEFQLLDALEKLPSRRYVVIDNVQSVPQEFDRVDDVRQAEIFRPVDAPANIPQLVEQAVAYIRDHQPGTVEVWLCSDLQRSSWRPEDGLWNLLHQRIQQLRQRVRFHLLAYPDTPRTNRCVRVVAAKPHTEEDAGRKRTTLRLSFTIERTGPASSAPETVPVKITLDGATTTVPVELHGPRAEFHHHELPLVAHADAGWGSITLPADTQPADDVSYFIYGTRQERHVVLVTTDAKSSRPIEIAASVTPDGETASEVLRVAPHTLQEQMLRDAAAVFWCAPLPQPEAAASTWLNRYVERGGQIVFFPSRQLIAAEGVPSGSFAGVTWQGWHDVEPVVANHWRSDQDVLAATESGRGLPVGEVTVQGYASMQSAQRWSVLASLPNGAPLLARLPRERGNVYFWAVSPDPKHSNLASDGVVLYVVVQRIIAQGYQAFHGAAQREARSPQVEVTNWRRVISHRPGWSSEFEATAGIYEVGSQLMAINRPPGEDEIDRVSDDEIDRLFADIPLTRLEQVTGSLGGVVREVWRIFLGGMVAALILEAILSLPAARGNH